jgi:hypothetical protein
LMVVIMLYNLVIVIYLFNKEMWKCFLAIWMIYCWLILIEQNIFFWAKWNIVW